MIDMTAIAEEMLPTVKVACRATSELFDPEITACIQAALADMLRMGVSEACFEEDSQYHALVLQAVIVYSKAHFGQDNPNAEMDYFRESYDRTVISLMNSAANSAAEDAGETTGASLGSHL
jgi:hypothetical protein